MLKIYLIGGVRMALIETNGIRAKGYFRTSAPETSKVKGLSLYVSPTFALVYANY